MAKTQTQTQPSTIVVISPTAPQQVVSPQVLASVLKNKGGSSSILAFSARYPMDDKGKMLKRGNPYAGRGIVKIARTQATVNWSSSEKKTEGRGGEFSGTGNHNQAVMIGNQVTPLSVHKEDIETYLPAEVPDDVRVGKRVRYEDHDWIVSQSADMGADGQKHPVVEITRKLKKEEKEIDDDRVSVSMLVSVTRLRYVDCIANHHAVIRDGVLVYTAPKPRFYLRYEIVRAPGKGERADRQMRSESFYQGADGTLIADEDIKPFLPKPKPRTDKTDIQTTKLENITELRIDGTVFKII
jgi:hypothetical protein|tara:strand:+ start:1038 stop:1931 length:894 start_codon:yes stop_codon:yes gene_type:complete